MRLDKALEIAKRVTEIKDAINRYEAAGVPYPSKWRRELNDIYAAARKGL